MKNSPVWKASDTTNAKYLGTLEIEGGGPFEILALPDRLLFGGATNAGFIESGYILREGFATIDECLCDLLADLETYYKDGPSYVSSIIHNERM